MLALWRDPPGTFLRMAREQGDIAHFRWGRTDEYLLSNPEHAGRVLVADQRLFMKGRALQEAKRILGNGLLTSEGEHHLRQRRLVQPLFHQRRVATYAEVMVACAERVASGWRDGDVLDVQREMSRLTLAIVGRTLFDADVEDEADELGAALTEAFESLNLLMLPFSPVLDALPLPSMRRLRRARVRLDQTIHALIRERRAGGRDRGDLLSLLLAARDEDGRRMTDEEVRDEAMTLFLAGHETTAVALTWTWFLLSAHPDAEARLHGELAAVLDGRPPTAGDLAQLPYARMILREAVRLYPPAWLIGRRALAYYELDGYPIRASSIVIVSPYVLHRDPRWFPDPARFDPERWVPDAEAGRPRYSYLPFGAGTRVCIGEGFAWTEAGLLLATIAQRWQLVAPKGTSPELLPRVTLRPKGGMPMVARRRTA